MKPEQQMGTVTQIAYSFIKEDFLVMNDELDPENVLDFLLEEDNFKRLADLLKETMITAGIPKDTEKMLKNYPTVSDFLVDLKAGGLNVSALSSVDSTNLFVNALIALLSQQEMECFYLKRKDDWNDSTISRWLNGSTKSIKNRENVIAICFALGLDYPTSRDFLNKSGHAIFNIRNHEDAVYIYCLTNHRPLSVAKELIHKYNKNLASFSIAERDNITHTGNTTLLLANQILGNSNWETDEEFFNSFLLPNMANFISYSRTAMKEYYKIKNPIYLSALRKIVILENKDNAIGHGFDTREIQAHIHRTHKDREISIPMSSVQVTHNFVNNLRKYSTFSDLFRQANDMLDIHVERICEKGWREEDFRSVNNSLDVIDFIIDNYAKYSNDEKELETISDFLTDTVTAYRMLCTYLPSVVVDNEDGKKYIKEEFDADGNIKRCIQKKDTRQRSYKLSTLSDTVLNSFPHRNFFTKYEKDPKEFVHRISLRKTIILLFYMNYAINLIQDISNPNTTDEEISFGFDDFYKTMNTILGRCQLGKLYCANPFDWLILESIEKLETYYDGEDIIAPVSFLDKVLDYSFGSEDD